MNIYDNTTPGIMGMIEELVTGTPDDTATASWIRNASEALLLAADHIEEQEVVIHKQLWDLDTALNTIEEQAHVIARQKATIDLLREQVEFASPR